MSNLTEEMDAVKTTIEKLDSVPELADQVTEMMEQVRLSIGDLVTSSQQYGKLKVRYIIVARVNVLPIIMFLFVTVFF